jgi:hypothetical protein
MSEPLDLASFGHSVATASAGAGRCGPAGHHRPRRRSCGPGWWPPTPVTAVTSAAPNATSRWSSASRAERHRGSRRPLYGGSTGRHCVLRARSAANQPRGRVITPRRAGSGRSADGRGTIGDLRAHGHSKRRKYGVKVAHTPAVRYAADSVSLRRSGVPEPDIRYALRRWSALCVFGDPRRAGLRVLLWSRAPQGPVGWWSWPVSGRARCPARAGQGGGGGADSGGRPRRSRRCAMSSGARRGLPYQAIGEKETQGGCS